MAKNLAPEWDEVFEFAVKDFTRRLEVEVLDADVVVDEAMGAFVIKLEDLLHKRRVRTLAQAQALILPNSLYDLFFGTPNVWYQICAPSSFDDLFLTPLTCGTRSVPQWPSRPIFDTPNVYGTRLKTD